MSDPGDDSAVLRIAPIWISESAAANKLRPCAFSSLREPDGSWTIVLSVRRNDRQCVYFLAVNPEGSARKADDGKFVWGLTQLDLHTWEVVPSVHIPTQLHAHITLLNVPEPAPWLVSKELADATAEVTSLRAEIAVLRAKVATYTERRFPVLEAAHGCPTWVPWAFVAPHEGWALRNHEQTLEKLASRGGLGNCELVAVVEGRKWKSMPDAEATARLKELYAAWEMQRGIPEVAAFAHQLALLQTQVATLPARLTETEGK